MGLIKKYFLINTNEDIGLFQKKKTGGVGGVRIWNFKGYQRNSMWNFQGLIKNVVEFPWVTKKK